MSLLLFTERKQVEDILGYLIAGNSAQMDDAAFIAELKSWLRFNFAEALATDDGQILKDQGVLPLCRVGSGVSFSVLFSRRTGRTKPMRPSSGQLGRRRRIHLGYEPAGFLEPAGRCCQRFARAGDGPGHSPLLHQPACRSPRGAEKSSPYLLGAGDRRPDLVMRFGYGPELPRSLRRPADQVLHPV